MNSFDRIMSAINFGIPDRVPVIAQVFGHAAIVEGVPLGNYLKDGEVLARCQLKALDRYGYDSVFALMDTSVETEAVGSRLAYRSDNYPYVREYAISDAGEIDRFAIPDPQKSGRMPELLKAAKILRSELGDDVLVTGCVMGPLTLATQLLGAEKALFLAADNPDLFSRVLDFAVKVIISFGIAQLEAGAHLPLVFDPSASPAVVPPQFFREFELPRLKKIFGEFKKAGSCANWLHIAGPAASIFPFYPEAGVEIANFDYCIDPLLARQILPRTCIDGNIKSISFIDSDQDEIASRSARLLDIFNNRGFILSSGCEIPPESDPKNIAAMVKAARKMR